MSRLWVSRRSLQVGAAEPRRRVARVPGVEVTGEEVERENCRDRSPAQDRRPSGLPVRFGPSDAVHLHGVGRSESRGRALAVDNPVPGQRHQVTVGEDGRHGPPPDQT